MGSDYQSGLGAGMARARGIRRDADSAIGEWASFAQDLKSMLLTESVERQVSVEYVRQLRAALREANPKHPLLQDAVAEQLFDRTRVAAFEQKGFHYNPSTGRFHKR